MKMHWEEHRSGTVLALAGELLADDTDVLRRRCDERLQAGIRLVLDIRELDRIDSAGLEAVLWLHESIQRFGGQLRLVRGDGQPSSAMYVTRVDRKLAMHTSLEAAARSFAKGQAA
jgi:anti-anti-sigma factor